MKLRFVAYCLLLFLLCLPADATVMRKLTVESLTQEADLIAIGRVVNMRTVVENGEPWTIVTVSLERPVKGNPSSVIRFRIPGGVQNVNGRTLVTQVEGAPVPNVNQKAVFFMSGRDPEHLGLTGLSQGYWRVENRQGKEVATPSADESAPAISLDRFVDDIRKAMKEKKERR